MVKVAYFDISNDAEKIKYEELLNLQETGEIKIIRDWQFTSKLGDPKIVVWYEDSEDLL